VRLRSGIDLVEVERLERLDAAVRERFLQRVFTPLELDETQRDWVSLAGRFAAKEAVAKALGCGIGPVAWQEIEIFRGSNGEPLLRLHGKAAERAAALGLQQWSLSISHTRTLAIAMAVAVGTDESA
jgi:holo-[acyl-carrier protein] synthase